MSSAYEDALALGNQGRYGEAEAQLLEWLQAHPSDRAGQAAFARLRLLQGRPETPEGIEARVALARSLSALIGPVQLQGSDEGPRLEKAAELILGVLTDLPDSAKPVAARILWRTANYAAAATLGGPIDLARISGRDGVPAEFLHQLAKVHTEAERAELLELHRQWAAGLERAAGEQPLASRPQPAERPRLRLGFLSSDLRQHVVAFFVQPLFEFLDPRFDLYIYSSHPGEPDVVQPWFEARAAGARKLPPDDREAAEIVAADDLDLLVDLGGPTSFSRPGVLAYRPARLQASWLGYPHSLGFSTLDWMIVDPRLKPTRAEWLLEAPLELPHTWVCMSPAAFHAEPVVAPAPVERRGFVTFGITNDPYKYSPKVLETWARVVATVPGSRLAIIRPEAGAPSFQDHVARSFAAMGVTRERLDFRAVRGGVKPLYAEIDIALDTFPITGGTTTCDALWMGVPMVTLVGEALHERVSWSLLSGLGLSDLGATSIDDYVRIAVALAKAPERISELRGTMRARILAMPLGQPRRFAADFYDTVARAISDRRGAPPQAV